MNPLTLHNALHIGYLRNPDKQKKRLKAYGYRLDTDLSHPRENVIAYNPRQNKVLYVPNGTDFSNQTDQQTDLLLGLSALKQSERYKRESNALMKAKAKYPGAQVVVAGHSLGGALATAVGMPSDIIYTYNPAAARNIAAPNALHLRTKGDVVSRFSSGTTQLNPTNLLPHKLHALNNIKRVPVFL